MIKKTLDPSGTFFLPMLFTSYVKRCCDIGDSLYLIARGMVKVVLILLVLVMVLVVMAVLLILVFGYCWRFWYRW